MSKERAKARAERQRLRSIEVQQRARERRRREWWQRRRDALSSLVPRPGTDSLLARRARRRFAWVLGGIAAVQLVVWPIAGSWGPRLLVLGLCLLMAPLVWVLLFDRR